MIESVQARPDTAAAPKVGELVERATRQMSELVRQEMQLARAEMTEKGKRAGIGGGMFGGAALIAVLALQALVAAAIAAVTLELPLWASCLIIAGGLGALAGLLALLGRKQFGRAVPPMPQEAMDGVRTDIEEIKERAHR